TDGDRPRGDGPREDSPPWWEGIDHGRTQSSQSVQAMDPFNVAEPSSVSLKVTRSLWYSIPSGDSALYGRCCPVLTIANLVPSALTSGRPLLVFPMMWRILPGAPEQYTAVGSIVVFSP